MKESRINPYHETLIRTIINENAGHAPKPPKNDMVALRIARMNSGDDKDVPDKKHDKEIIERQKKIIKSSPADEIFFSNVRELTKTSVWLDKFSSIYQERFTTNPPPNWLEMITASDEFETDECFGKKLLVAVQKTNVRKTSLAEEITTKKPAEGGKITPVEVTASKLSALMKTRLGPKLNNGQKMSALMKSRLGPRVNNAQKKNLPELILPVEVHWDIYVMDTTDKNHLWCRLIGKEYSDKYDDMIAALELKMMNASKKLVTAVIGELYTVSIDGSWHRVRLLALTDNCDAQVFNIDGGEIETVEVEQLHPLEDDFRGIAAQAFKVCIDGFDRMSDVVALRQAMLEQIVGRICVAEVVHKLSDHPDKLTAHVILWDTSTTEDINISLLLMEKVVATIKGPTLSRGLTSEMRISHMAESGTVYLQNSGYEMRCVSWLIDHIKDNFDLPKVETSGNIGFSKVYLARHPKTGFYQRVKVLTISDSLREANVIFIDFGFEAPIQISELVEVFKLSESLAIAPPQAMQASLSGVDLFLDGTPRVIEDINVLVKLIKIEKGSHYVELFLRREPNAEVTPIIDMLKSCSTKEKKDEEIVGQVMLPDVGSLFNVTVTLAANPHLFTVQPAELASEVMHMMTNLQQAEIEFLPKLRETDLVSGNLYAVHYTDGNWYRGKVKAVMGMDLVSIELSDFGSLVILSSDQIRTLPENFRKLPCLGISARLAQVKPVNGDWTPDDCLLFQDLVLHKSLASVVVDIIMKESGPVLDLILIDTTSDEDEIIAQRLIDDGIAQSTS